MSNNVKITLNVSYNMDSDTNKAIDKITLELLLNKTHYAKYLAKTDPQLFAEYQEFLESCNHFHNPIVEITTQLLNNPKETQYGQSVSDAFDRYAKTLIRYLEVKEMSDNVQDSLFDRDDEDTLFPEEKMSSNKPSFSSSSNNKINHFFIPRIKDNTV